MCVMRWANGIVLLKKNKFDWEDFSICGPLFVFQLALCSPLFFGEKEIQVFVSRPSA
jgi:hypothetical protein